MRRIPVGMYLQADKSLFSSVYIIPPEELSAPATEHKAAPVWFRIEEVPYHEMWEDDKYWLPAVLRGEKVYGRFFFERWKLKKGEVYLLKDAGQLLLNLRQLPA
jgi:hypothetical protein